MHKIYAGLIQQHLKKLNQNVPKVAQIGYIGNRSYKYDDQGNVYTPSNDLLFQTDVNLGFDQVAEKIAQYLIHRRMEILGIVEVS